MKKFIIALVLVSSVTLGGCAGMAEQALNLPSGVLTQSVSNPVTREHLYRLENGLIVGVTALNSYKKLCNSGQLPSNCIATVATLQSYVKRGRPLLRQLRTFVRKNDQVNARVVFDQVQMLLVELRGTAAAAGIPIPQTP